MKDNTELVKGLINPNGVLTVEVFNKDKKLIQKHKKHNFISQGFYEWLQLLMVERVIKPRPRSITDPSNELYDIELDGWVDLFARMELTSANHLESPLTEWIMRGDVIGYALSTGTYSGDDVLRGTLNTSESFVKVNNARFVFDFGTDKAFGTFQSVYFRPQQGYATNRMPNHAFRIFNHSSTKVKKYNNKYYVLDGTTFYIYDENFNLENEYPNITGQSFLRDFTVYNNYIYFCHSWSSAGITRAPISDPTAQTLVLSGVFDGIDFDTATSRFYTVRNEGNTTTGYSLVISEYNTNLEILNSRTVRASTSSNPSITGLVIADGVMILPSNTASDMIGSMNGSYHRSREFSNRISGVDENGVFVGSRKIPKIYIGSRILLDEPVTKTDTTTMKITYDLTINNNFQM